MRIVVTSNGANLDASASPLFGRCSTFVLIDTETMAFEAVENPAVVASGGAGVQAAQYIVEKGAQAVVTGNVGPNAFQVFQSVGIPVHLFAEGTVRQAAEAYLAGDLPVAGGATAPEHAGMAGRYGVGGRGGVGGTGRAMQPPAPHPSHQKQVAALKETVGQLRGQLAEVIEQLDRLEKGA